MLISVIGDVTMPRRYHYCDRCKRGMAPMDAWAGLDRTHLTPRGRRLVVLAGSDHSFDRASDRLRRMCGVKVSDQTVRRACESAGAQAQVYLKGSSHAADPVKRTKGRVECLIDGAKVNTTQGWREIRAVVLCKREAGKATDLRHWDDRVLPDPSATWSWAGIADAAEVGRQLRSMADRLDLGPGLHVSALADGAKWIWGQLHHHLPDHEGVLDVYHMLEHLHDAGRALHGEGDEARQWAEHQRAALFRDGPHHYLRKQLLPLARSHRQREPHSPATRLSSPKSAKALVGLLTYLWPHRGRMRYRQRLLRGLPIGSGQVEGVCKNTLNRRLRLNNARWRPDHVDPIAALACLHHSQQWDTFWTTHHSPDAQPPN